METIRLWKDEPGYSRIAYQVKNGGKVDKENRGPLIDFASQTIVTTSSSSCCSNCMDNSSMGSSTGSNMCSNCGKLDTSCNNWWDTSGNRS